MTVVGYIPLSTG